MTLKLFRRGTARCIGLLSASVTILLCLYYISVGQSNLANSGKAFTSTSDTLASADAAVLSATGMTSAMDDRSGSISAVRQPLQQNSYKDINSDNNKNNYDVLKYSIVKQENSVGNYNIENGVQKLQQPNPATASPAIIYEKKCYQLDEQQTNITAIDEFAKFNFQPEWIRTKEYWDRSFEERFENQKLDEQRPPLKIIIVPHSHNDPGWLKTFINYFQSDSRQIINLMVNKMQEFTDMTFIWSEISFLQLWWDQAHPTKQRALKRLINSGRFEITTGGWVMTDEANVHLYAMLDQLIEGHQWLKNNLNVTPNVGWSIDPFGHGSTMPYLLSGSNFKGTIIQRIHYAWKQWFARQMNGDFIWTPYWQHRDDSSRLLNKGQLLTHNMPFDIYSIKGSCGPHPFICLNFDFRKIPGEYTEYSIRAQFINEENVKEKAQLLLEQYRRTASLFSHNVALIPVGDDFRYNKEREVIQQYSNYKKLIDYIMTNKDVYNVDIGFGTPKDYFREVEKRTKQFPTFKGDFFVYSDIFSEGRPAYWSGYYTTRPFYKILSTDLEHNLRAAEILFTVAYNTARQHKHEIDIKIFEKNYEKMIHARRNLGLFQHHDAITGTSKAVVMRDYAMRLFESLQSVVKMQESTIELLIQNGSSSKHNFLLNSLERDSFNKLPRKTTIPLTNIDQSSELLMGTRPSTVEEEKSASVVIFNPLTHKQLTVLTIRVPTYKVKLLNERGEEIRNIQINPIWNITDSYSIDVDQTNTGSMGRIQPSKRVYELMFMAELEALSITKYQVVVDDINYKRLMSTIYCDRCGDQKETTAKPKSEQFTIKSKPPGNIQLENNHMRLLFDEKSGFLTSITRKGRQQQLLKPMQCSIKFAAYRSAQFHSGAYLFKTDPEQTEAEKDILEQYEDVRIIITSGNIASDVTVLYGPFLAHTVRLLNTHTPLDAGIFIENDIDFEPPPKNRETELFMRFITDIDNIASVKKKSGNDNEAILELPQFYTDQNGFQYHRRIKVPSIGIEGNYFPITTTAFIQDTKHRLTLLTTHAQGAASYEPGQLEVMLDRRTLYDDYRGMGEGVVDSRLTRHQFWLLIEDIESKVQSPNTYQVPSLLANYLANSLRYPPNIYFVENFDSPPQLKSKIHLLNQGSWPCDIHLINLRTLSDEQLEVFPSSSALLILQRQGYDCGVNSQLVDMSLICERTAMPTDQNNTQFNNVQMKYLEATSLTGTIRNQRLKSLANIEIRPMEVLTFNVTFHSKQKDTY